MPTKLSYSAASRFKQCPQKYYHSLKFYSKIKAAALPFGSAIEEGVTVAIMSGDMDKAKKTFELHWTNERNSTRFPVFNNPEYEYSKADYDQSIAERVADEIIEDLRESNLEYETWTEAFDTLSATYFAKEPLSDDELGFIVRTFWRSCLERGKLMLDTFSTDLLPLIESVVPVDGQSGVQVPISIENGEGDSVIGYVDYVLKLKGYDEPVVVDCKTAAMVYQTHDIETSEQLRTYVQVLQEKIGPCHAAFMVLGKKIKFQKSCIPCDQAHSPQSKKCKSCKEPLSKTPHSTSQLLVTKYTDQMLDLIISDYDNILQSIDAEVNFRNTASCRLYNRPCEFYDVCWKNKNPENLEHLTKKKGYRK